MGRWGKPPKKPRPTLNGWALSAMNKARREIAAKKKAEEAAQAAALKSKAKQERGAS